MENTVNNPILLANLHPIWRRHCGLPTAQSNQTRITPKPSANALIRAAQALAAAYPTSTR
jgi:hypothetical protein